MPEPYLGPSCTGAKLDRGCPPSLPLHIKHLGYYQSIRRLVMRLGVGVEAEAKERVMPGPYLEPSCTGSRGTRSCHTLIKLLWLKSLFNIMLKKDRVVPRSHLGPSSTGSPGDQAGRRFPKPVKQVKRRSFLILRLRKSSAWATLRTFLHHPHPLPT